MGIRIRQGVFETNSSSMHSIALRTGEKRMETPDYWERKYMIMDGVLSPFIAYNDLEFHRGFDILFRPEERLAYAIAEFCNHCDYDEDMDKAEEIVKSLNIPGVTEIDLPDGYNGEPNFGFIDHQSSGLLRQFLDSQNMSISEFVYNNDILVFIDSDENPHNEVYTTNVLLYTGE